MAKGERSLKYETTKPVSSKASKRIKSATGRLEGGPAQKNDFMQITNKDLYQHLKGDGPLPEKSDNRESARRQLSARDKFGSNSMLNEVREIEEDYRQMKVKIKKPESVVRFEEDLLTMNDMENEFRNATKALQRKLGISANGMI